MMIKEEGAIGTDHVAVDVGQNKMSTTTTSKDGQQTIAVTKPGCGSTSFTACENQLEPCQECGESRVVRFNRPSECEPKTKGDAELPKRKRDRGKRGKNKKHERILDLCLCHPSLRGSTRYSGDFGNNSYYYSSVESRAHVPVSHRRPAECTCCQSPTGSA